jgi:hypothetical protein
MHCYYQKVRNGVAYYGPFPAIFGRMNGMLQTSIIGKNLADIHSDLPSGIVESQEGFLKSIPVPGAEDCFISGRFDILSKLDDGTYSIIDFKITNPDEEQIKKFASQLHAYKFALENPAEGEAIKISKMGLISINPENIEHKDGKFVFTTSPKWHPIEDDMESFFGLIKEIQDVLNGDLPSATETCALCAYRGHFEPGESVTDEIPF